MTQAEIKHHCDLAYESIKVANDKLVKLRAICKHPNTHKGLYSWRIGCIEERDICSYCGEVLPNSDRNVQVSDTTDDDQGYVVGNKKTSIGFPWNINPITGEQEPETKS